MNKNRLIEEHDTTAEQKRLKSENNAVGKIRKEKGKYRTRRMTIARKTARRWYGEKRANMKESQWNTKVK